jgi:hypothetical protein
MKRGRNPYLAIHHDIFPDGEQITLRSLGTGEKLASLLWRGKGNALFDLRSAAVDGESMRIVGLAENFFSDQTDAVLSWDGRGDSLIENVEIQPPQNQDYVPASAYGNNHSFRTDISLAHPYYVRTRLRSSGKGIPEPKEYTAQIVDWQNMRLLKLPLAAINFLSVISEPLSARFRYAAVLQGDGKAVQLVSFDEIARQMAKAPPPVEGLLGHVGKALRSFARIGSKSAISALAGTAPGQYAAALPEFSASLAHDHPVRKAVLSKWAPFLVTQSDAGLHIWNAKTGDEIGSIDSSVKDFRVLDQMGLLAYADGSGNLALYSLLQARQVATFSGFSYYNLDSRLENRSQGLAYVTLDNGLVMQVAETFAHEPGQPSYDASDTGLTLKLPLNRSYRTAIQTKKGRYFLQVYERQERDAILTVDVFTLDGKGRKIASLSFPMSAFQAEFRLDPSGNKVIYARDETETGILHLDRLLAGEGL